MKYSKYKELDTSGISWLQKKPRHWRIKRLKFSTDLINNKISVEDSNLPYLGLEHIESWTGRIIDGEISNSEGLASSFFPGDVLFGKLRPYLAKVHLTQQAGLISSEALVVRSRDELHAEFLKYYMLSRDFINIVDSSTYGSKMPRASWDFIGNLPILLPEVEEQKIIARFLDFKTEKIDSLISKKKSLLNKLTEKRTTLISQAVTKGLDPSVPMKKSGVAWLGEIPAHWRAIRIKHITPVKRGASPRPIDDPKFFDDDGDFSWVRIADLSASDRYLKNTTQRLSELGASLSVKRFPGDLFLSIAGTVGKPIITNIKCCIHDGFVYFPDLQESSEFFYYIFACGQPYLGLGKMGTQLNLNTDTVGSILVGLPTKDEQLEIVRFLDEKTAKLDEQAEKANRVIDCLNEYRSALITNAVTGKIDVRGFEIPQSAEGLVS